jgi:hypothetical protein
MTEYVFSLGLIPVQDWIAQSRRSRDLRAGSVLLWHAMVKLLARLEREGQTRGTVEIWTPEPPPAGFSALAKLSFREALSTPYGLPNRASGWCTASDDEAVQEWFGALERELTATWLAFRVEAIAQLPRMGPGAEEAWGSLKPHWQAYERSTPQGEDLPLSLIWSARPAPFPRERRKENLAAAFALFADVKRSRPAPRGTPGAAVGKCTQCGQREAVGPTRSFESWRDWYARWAETLWVQRGYRLDAGERLCFVCLAKRLKGYEARRDFPSTGEIAARGWLERLEARPDLRDLLTQLRRTDLGDEDLGQALYGAPASLPEEVRALRTAIRKRIEDHNREVAIPIPTAPPGYLALLAFDGDDMGRQMTANPHLAPKAMARFAVAAADVLADHGAESFYLAGDEGLAMVPADKALPLALALRQSFRTAFEGLAAEEGGSQPTLSAGIAFFEHGRPMRGAILGARRALEAAKAKEGKDALGAEVETASGSRWDFTASWGEDWERVRAATERIASGGLSPGWAYDAERFLETLPTSAWAAELVSAARAELRRLFLRRVRVEGSAEERRAAKLEAWDALRGDSWWPVDAHGVTAPVNPQQLHLIGFLARQVSPGEGGTDG